MPFFANLAINFFVALGMVVGGSLLGGMGALLIAYKAPMSIMLRLSDQLKIWAMVSALGGTMDTLRVIESGVLTRDLYPVGKQLTYLIAAFVGCQAGALLIHWLVNGEYRWQ